jgi:hypothetical protein
VDVWCSKIKPFFKSKILQKVGDPSKSTAKKHV